MVVVYFVLGIGALLVTWFVATLLIGLTIGFIDMWRQRKQVYVVLKPDGIQDLLESYLQIAIKHGADSHEAQAFKFGLDNQVVFDKSTEEQASLKCFLSIVEIFEKVLAEHSRAVGGVEPETKKKGKKS